METAASSSAINLERMMHSEMIASNQQDTALTRKKEQNEFLNLNQQR